MRVPRVISALFPYWCSGDSTKTRAFTRVTTEVDAFLERTKLPQLLKRRLMVVDDDVSGYAHCNNTLYLNEYDATHSDLAIKNKTYLYLHELGHLFLEGVIPASSYEKLKKHFGNFDKRYKRVADADADERDFVSPYAMVHPMDDFAETFAVCLYSDMRSPIKLRGKSAKCREKLKVMRETIKQQRKR